MLIINYVSFDIRELGQKYKNIFVRVLVQMKTLNFAFENNWPLKNYFTQSRAQLLGTQIQIQLIEFFLIYDLEVKCTS